MSEQLYDPPSDEISLRPYIEALRRYKRHIALHVLTAIVLFTVTVIGAYVILPKERIGVLGFRLLFAGADSNQYPNGSPFNAEEIVASPVLSEVYEANDLKRYTTLSRLQESIVVLHSSRAMQQLDRSYLAKLGDTKLTPVDRAKMEDEYAQRRDSIRDPEYTLNLTRADRLTEMPRPLVEKILVDTLEVWSRQTESQKGATRPDIDLFSEEIFSRAADENETFLVRIDVLRIGAQRMIKALMALHEIPGVRSVRTKDNRSLADELATIEDILKFDIEPLMGLARVGGRDSEDRVLLMAYISNQLVTYRLNLRTAVTRAQNMQTSLREYMAQRGGRIATSPGPPAPAGADPSASPTPVPQLGDSFIDRLLELSAATEGPEAEYRRSLTDKFIEASDAAAAAEREIGYYDDLLRQLSAPPSVGASVSKQLIEGRFDRVLKTLVASVNRTQELYSVVSQQTLNPAKRLYTITQPFGLQTRSVLPFRTLIMAFALTMLVTLIASVIGCLVHNQYHAPMPTPSGVRSPLSV